jgi:Na+-driven multidrug efflux pump
VSSGWIAAVYNLAFTAGLVALYFAYMTEIIGFFDDSAAVLAVARQYVMWVAPSYCLLALAVVLSQAMNGAGATLSSMMLDSGLLLLVVIPAAIVVTAVLGMPRTALWSTIAIGNGLGALTFIVWYRRGRFLPVS